MDGNSLGTADGVEAQANEDDDFKIKGAATRALNRGKQKASDPVETCTICLEAISERAVAVPCNHLTFDFICLVSWLQERSTCPLCNGTVTAVQYDFRDPEDYKTYHVPESETKTRTESDFERSRRRRGQDSIRRRTERPHLNQTAQEDPALEQRRRVYREKLYSLHIGANRLSQYRDFTPHDFTNSEELQRRARMFVRRELQVFSFLNTAAAPRGGNREFLLEYIVAILKTNELKGASGHAEDLLTDYLGRGNATLLLHELEAWLRSPYTTLADWDSHVQYPASRAENASKVVEG